MDMSEAFSKRIELSIFDALEVALYVCRQEEKISENTWKARVISWQQYCFWASEVGADILGGASEVGLAYLHHLLALGRAPATVMNRVAQIRSLYRCWGKLGLLTEDPFAQIRLPANQPAARRRLFNQEECEQLLKLKGEEVQAFLSLGLFSGVDAQTITDLCWADLEADQPRYKRLSVKSRHALKRLYQKNHLRGAPPAGWIFPALRTKDLVDAHLKKLCCLAEVRPQSWLALRTTAGVQAVKTRPLQRVQQQMGYTSVRSVHYLNQRRRYDQGEPVTGQTGRSHELGRAVPGMPP